MVKETLLGIDQTEEELQLSVQTKATFEKHALRGAETGEQHMTEKEFIEAIAPEGEDYVSQADLVSHKSF